ncbi:MAG: SpoIIE family protein phosphatase [Limisphaerales bacterium]|jgi:sigma-B regulation protein RsbU (phosphoserine phosphatase)|nr:SpoIIE family protein phosphatase [Verrucomicrobiota bacterium]
MSKTSSSSFGKPPLRLLVVDDSAFDAQMIASKLQIYGYETEMERVETLADFRKAMTASTPWEVIISDYFMPDLKMMDILEYLKKTQSDTPFIIVSGGIGEAEAVAAMKAGANDYVLKDNLQKLGAVVDRELRDVQIARAQKEAEIALKESEYRYRTLWENSKDALILVDAKRNILLCSPATESIFGYPDEFLQQKPLSTLQPPEKFPQRPLLSECFKNGTIHLFERTETQALHKTGKVVDIEVDVSKIILKGEIIACLSIRDVTEWNRTQAERSRNRDQLRFAQEIHKNLYPSEPPDFPGYDIAGKSYPAEEIGGDYFDFFSESEHTLDVGLGDVSGHGLGPAILMSETRAYLRILSRTRENLDEILTRTNEVLAEDMAGKHYVTLTLLRLISRPPSLIYANAGHIAGYILNSVGDIKQRLTRTGIVLGRKKNSTYTQSDFISLDEGDLILLMTDGMQEVFSESEEMFGAERILEVIRKNIEKTSSQIIDEIYKEGIAFASSSTLDDDFTCVIIKVTPED